jgi:hypothetical protein
VALGAMGPLLWESGWLIGLQGDEARWWPVLFSESGKSLACTRQRAVQRHLDATTQALQQKSLMFHQQQRKRSFLEVECFFFFFETKFIAER